MKVCICAHDLCDPSKAFVCVVSLEGRMSIFSVLNAVLCVLYFKIMECTMKELLTASSNVSKVFYIYIFVLVNLKFTLITLLKFVLVLVVIDSFKYIIPKNFDVQNHSYVS